jgi:hypothetical protein
MHAYRRRDQLILFDDVDVNTQIEQLVKGRRSSTPVSACSQSQERRGTHCTDPRPAPRRKRLAKGYRAMPFKRSAPATLAGLFTRALGDRGQFIILKTPHERADDGSADKASAQPVDYKEVIPAAGH